MADQMKDWTILVYMAGDNNLSDDMANQLDVIYETIERSGQKITKDANVLVFFDGVSETAPTRYIDFSNGKPFKQQDVNIDDYAIKWKSQKIAAGSKRRRSKQVGEGDSATAYSIMNFVQWAIEERKCKAENYFMIFSGHSSGFGGNTFLGDSQSNSYMTIFMLRWALEQIVERFLKKEIAILGFDSCLMGMFEVAYELKGSARMLAVSEGNFPNSGWPFGLLLDSKLYTRKSGMSFDVYLSTVAEKFVEGFVGKQARLAVGGRSADIAVLDLTKVSLISDALAKLAKTLFESLNIPLMMNRNKLNPVNIMIMEQVKHAILECHAKCQSFRNEQYVDLYDFCELLAIEFDSLERQMQAVKFKTRAFRNLKTQCIDVMKAVRSCVVSNGFAGDAYQFANGVSLYFPWTAMTYSESRSMYQWLRFTTYASGGVAWLRFLEYYLFIATLRRKREFGVDNQDVRGSYEALAETPVGQPRWLPSGREDWRIRTREDWRFHTREDWRIHTREDWRLHTRENWLLRTRENWKLKTRENWRLNTRENWRINTRGDMSSSPGSLGSIKNYQLDWNLRVINSCNDVDESTLIADVYRVEDGRDSKS